MSRPARDKSGGASRNREQTPQAGQLALPSRTVVVAVLTWAGRIGLFRRSASVRGDQHLWHCISGFLPPSVAPLHQAFAELAEETGLQATELRVAGNATLDLAAADGIQWRIHAFHFESSTDRVTLNWEHDASCWVSENRLVELPIVSWLPAVINAMAMSITPCLMRGVSAE